MFYAMGFYPQLSPELAESIGAIRSAHDPAHGFAAPHITVLFPIPESVGEAPLIRHIETVLNECEPFPARLGALTKSRDHWLFLTLTEGEGRFREIHSALYSGLLATHRRDDITYIPHVSLGLFLRQGAVYDWDNPQEADFDRERYEAALSRAGALPLPAAVLVDKLRLSRFPNEIVEWTTGKRLHFPVEARAEQVREFLLG